MQEADDSGSPVTWGEHVTDEEYEAARRLEQDASWREVRCQPPGRTPSQGSGSSSAR
jgi:hypothetical protein